MKPLSSHLTYIEGNVASVNPWGCCGKYIADATILHHDVVALLPLF